PSRCPQHGVDGPRHDAPCRLVLLGHAGRPRAGRRPVRTLVGPGRNRGLQDAPCLRGPRVRTAAAGPGRALPTLLPPALLPAGSAAEAAPAAAPARPSPHHPEASRGDRCRLTAGSPPPPSPRRRPPVRASRRPDLPNTRATADGARAVPGPCAR